MWWVSARFRMIALIGCVFFCACQKSFEAGPTVFLASSFASVADDIKARLPKAATIILMNSSAIARQIEQGAPCDGAILADNSWNFWLSERNIAEPAGVVAVNSLVLASATPMSSIKDLSFYLQHLKSQEKIIIADPDYVPLGRYTKEALSNLGLDQQLEAHFIKAHSARHASFMLKHKAAAFAIIYRSDALLDKLQIVASIAPHLHRAVEYSLLVCNSAKSDSKRALEAVVFSKDFRISLRRKGFY